MNSTDRKRHWDNVYSTKKSNEVSWHQDKPVTSLDFVKELSLPADAWILDCGGGDSYLVDNLLEMGYKNITVLDISETALEKAKHRLGEKAESVKWVSADGAYCKPCGEFDLWHDRAAFHFLADENEINNYINIAGCCTKPGGYLVIGTFSTDGPEKCSGLPVTRYSEESITHTFGKFFEPIKCIKVDHKTPFNTVQNFIFCCFKRKH